jgi:hypothetical protein
MQEPEDTRLLIRYLLGDLIEEEQEKIEERYSSDDNFYFKLLTTEDELIDSYVLGEISQSDRKKFEQAYLSNPYRLKKVESNKIWLELVARRLAPTPWYQRIIESLQRTLVSQRVSFNYSLAGLLLVGLLCGVLGWLLWERMRLRGELAQANSQLNQKEIDYERRIAELNQSRSNLPPEPSPGLPAQQQVSVPEKKETKAPGRSYVVAYVLPRVGVRTPNGAPESLKPLVIRRGTNLVRLTVDLEPNGYSEYKISLQKIGEPKIWDRSLSKNQPGFSARRIVINLPADLFETQDYILKVTASDPADEQILAFRHLTVINENLSKTNIENAR